MFEDKTYKRCGCKGPLFHQRGPEAGQPVLDDQGRQKHGPLDTSCPDLETPGHGSWYYGFDLPPGKNGKRARARRGGYRTQEEAAKAAERVWMDARRGVTVTGTETVGSYLTAWFKDLPLKETTAHGYDSHLRLYLLPYLGHVQCRDLNLPTIKAAFRLIREESDERQKVLDDLARLTVDVDLAHTRWKAADKPHRARARERWTRARQALAEAREAASPGLDKRGRRQKPPQPISNATLHRIKATLSSALKEGVIEGRFAQNWAEHLTLPAARRPKPLLWTSERVAQWKRTGEKPGAVMVWTPQQTGAFLDFVTNDRLYPLWHLIVFRGQRRGEAAGMRWRHTDLDLGTIFVTRQINTVGYATMESDPKQDSDRTLDLDIGSWDLLKIWREQQAQEHAQWAAAGALSPNAEDFVWTQEDGSPYHPQHFTDRFNLLVEKAGLPPIRLHDLRHGAATLALAAGVDKKVVQEMLGHSSYHLTEDTYTSVLPEVSRLAAEAARSIVPRAGQAAPTGSPMPVNLVQAQEETRARSSSNRVIRQTARRRRRVILRGHPNVPDSPES
ncbi:tyrosine-type recombinase/integrase [Streptomyces albidoflavus]|uniref:tyrosine-type recombinase/integrase n=1 Tax=Streptomyces albidoflavus TaxID=1886 RepID=UPI003402A0EC